MCITYLRNIDYRKKANWWRHCDALDSVLLGDHGSCHPCVWCSLTCTTYLSITADHVHPFTETVFPDECGLFQQDNLRNTTNEVLNCEICPIYMSDPCTAAPHNLQDLNISWCQVTTAHLQGSSGLHVSMGQGLIKMYQNLKNTLKTRP